MLDEDHILKPNILFLLVDGLRSDKCQGDKKTSITPNIDKLVKNGTYFTQAISSAPNTIASVSSIFTSMYPFECIVRKKNVFQLNSTISTYIDDLLDYGYHSYAITQELISHMGLRQIFKNNVETYHRSLKLYSGLGNKILKKLDVINMSEPWFFYIHLSDLQWLATLTYISKEKEPDEISDKKFGVNKYERLLSMTDIWIGNFLEKINLEKTLVILTSDHGSELGDYDSDLELYRKSLQKKKTIEYGTIFNLGRKTSNYLPEFLIPVRKKLAEVYTKRRNRLLKSRMKPEIEKIRQKELRPYQRRIIENSILFTAEGFDERFRVPLIFTGYTVPSGKVISQLVRSVDIFPTILGIIGYSKYDERRGRNIFPLMIGKELDELPVYIDTAVNSPLSSTSNVIGIRTSKFKYFRNRNDPNENVNLYDLEKDPLEENNIAVQRIDVVKSMENLLKEIKNDRDFNIKESDAIFDDETEKIEHDLRKLGYI